MTIEERQLTLETRLYRKKSFGKENFCDYCFARSNTCIASSKERSCQYLCAKAETRMNSKPRYKDTPNKKYKPKLGLRRIDLW